MDKKPRIILELAFFAVLFIAYRLGNVNEIPFLLGLVIFLILYVHALIHRFLILPLMLAKKAYIKYFFFLIANLLIFTFIDYHILLYQSKRFDPSLLQLINYGFAFAQCILSLFVMSSIELVIRYFAQEKEKKDYKLMISKLENNNLRSQLNPHFLFNSLNNAYGISLSEPQKTPDYLMHLSQLMRYQIDATKNETVLLFDDVEYIKNYIAVEKERVEGRCSIHFENTIEETALQQYRIAPLLFTTFIENAIQHGAASMDASSIVIAISNEQNKLQFKISNTLPKKELNTTGTGIGLKNVQQRLQFLYPKKHNLEIVQTEKNYSVTLHISL
jgi:two-component system, LytTR family, sensor kinase